MKLGVSFQYPEKLTPSHLSYLRNMGVETIEVRMFAETYDFDDLLRVQDKVTKAGLDIHEVMLQDMYNRPSITTGGIDRDRDIETFQDFLRDLGKAGIRHTTYAWHSGGAGMTGETTSRGARTRFFEQAAALATPNVYDRTYSDDDMWETYFYFMERMLPVAEEANVRLQLHPNDPPLTHQGVARIFRDVASFRRAFDAVDHNPVQRDPVLRRHLLGNARRRWHRRGHRGGDSRIRAGRPHHAGAPAQYVESHSELPGDLPGQRLP